MMKGLILIEFLAETEATQIFFQYAFPLYIPIFDLAK